MSRLHRIQLLGVALSLGFVGCRAAPTNPVVTPTPPPSMAAMSSAPNLGGAEQLPTPIPDGSYSVPNFGATPGAPPLAAQQVAAADCVEAGKPKRGWRRWLPTTDHSNDPRRERGQTTDGWYEPEFRGISD